MRGCLLTGGQTGYKEVVVVVAVEDARPRITGPFGDLPNSRADLS